MKTRGLHNNTQNAIHQAQYNYLSAADQRVCESLVGGVVLNAPKQVPEAKYKLKQGYAGLRRHAHRPTQAYAGMRRPAQAYVGLRVGLSSPSSRGNTPTRRRWRGPPRPPTAPPPCGRASGGRRSVDGGIAADLWRAAAGTGGRGALQLAPADEGAHIYRFCGGTVRPCGETSATRPTWAARPCEGRAPEEPRRPAGTLRRPGHARRPEGEGRVGARPGAASASGRCRHPR